GCFGDQGRGGRGECLRFHQALQRYRAAIAVDTELRARWWTHPAARQLVRREEYDRRIRGGHLHGATGRLLWPIQQSRPGLRGASIRFLTALASNRGWVEAGV